MNALPLTSPLASVPPAALPLSPLVDGALFHTNAGIAQRLELHYASVSAATVTDAAAQALLLEAVHHDILNNAAHPIPSALAEWSTFPGWDGLPVPI